MNSILHPPRNNLSQFLMSIPLLESVNIQRAREDALNDTVVVYDVPPWLEDDEVASLLKQLDDGLFVDSIT